MSFGSCSRSTPPGQSDDCSTGRTATVRNSSARRSLERLPDPDSAAFPREAVDVSAAEGLSGSSKHLEDAPGEAAAASGQIHAPRALGQLSRVPERQRLASTPRRKPARARLCVDPPRDRSCRPFLRPVDADYPALRSHDVHVAASRAAGGRRGRGSRRGRGAPTRGRGASEPHRFAPHATPATWRDADGRPADAQDVFCCTRCKVPGADDGRLQGVVLH